MALGFTSHFTNADQPFGTLLLGASDTETAGSIALNDSPGLILGALYNGETYDSCEFSVSVNVDYSQYANYVGSSGAAETAGSVAYSGSGCDTASTVSFSGCGGGCSVSSGGCSTVVTC